MSPGQTIDVERLEAAEGGTVELDKVLLIADGEKITAGKPVVEGARVIATVQGNGRGGKIIVLKYKPKVRYRKKTGHRQSYTRLAIDRIEGPGAKAEKPARKARKAKAEVTSDGS